MVAKQIITILRVKFSLTHALSFEYEISSHTLKMATLWSLEDVKNSSQRGVSSENDYSQLDSHQLQRQVEAIFGRLWQFSVQDFVPSFFMPSLHVAVWKFEIFPKFSHTFLRRTYSDYRKLFNRVLAFTQCERDIHKEGTECNIVDALVGSFGLLYAVSSHCSRSTDWVFPTIVDDDD